MVINKLGIREQNEATVLQAIITQKNISRIQISKKTHLNKASVSQITKKLIDDHFIFEVGSGHSTTSGGRKPIQLAFNGKCGVAVAFDVGYNYIKSRLAYVDGTPINSISKQNLELNQVNICPFLQEILDELLLFLPQTSYGLTGIGIAIHGIVENNQMTFTPYYDLVGLDFVTSLEKVYDVPVFLENEANLTGLGEYCFASTQENLISISVHSGIGAGIITNGRLQTGHHGASGEIGHSILFPDGKKCPCGNHGCLEQYASNKVLFDNYAKQAHLSFVNSDVFAEKANQNEKLAIRLAHENSHYLAIGINNLTTLFDPETIYINSSVYRKIPFLVGQLQELLNSRFTKDVLITNSQLGENATLYGGVALVSSQFLHIEKLKFPVDETKAI